MLENIEVLYHSCIKISKEKIIYFDPFHINIEYHDADIIFITHDHYDHFSENDIYKVKKENTKILAPDSLLEKILVMGFKEENITTVDPGETGKIEDIEYETVPAYNIDKPYHPKENDWIGYILKIDDVKYYIAGDTDITEENRRVQCDVAFVPVGGTYTMDFKDAALLINEIQPKIAVPIHYGSVVGTKQDAENFVKLLHSSIKGIFCLCS